MSYFFNHFMICISGYSGSGKDEFAKVFVDELQAPKVGLADPAKRHMADLYGFDEHQLFGPSAARNAGDIRYPKPSLFKRGLVVSDFNVLSPPSTLANPEAVLGKKDIPYWEYEGSIDMKNVMDFPYIRGTGGKARVFVPEGHPEFWLSPRESLQLYCELMNTLYGDTWVRKSVATHFQLGNVLEFGGQRFMRFSYDRMSGPTIPSQDKLVPAPESGGSFFSCSADFRHRHEFNAFRRVNNDRFIPVMVRVKRPSVPTPPFDHRSETEQATIPDSFFDFVVDNDGTVEGLHVKAREIASVVQTPGWQPLRGSL